MADMFLGPVIKKVIDLLAEEVKSLKGVRKEVQSLQKELDFSYSFLKYAEGKPEKGDTNDLMLTWVKQVMDEANRAEEIIDEYRYLVEAEKHHRQSSFRKAGGFFKDFKQRRDMASKIQEVNDSLGKIKDRVERYGLRLPLEQGASSTTTNVEAPDPRLKSRFIEKDEFVGIEAESEEILQKLLEGSPTRSVISLVGQGGIGKTTLATNVYDDAAVQEKFESRAWITVSRAFNLKKILKSMRRQVCKSEPVMEEVEDADEQIQYLRKSLEAKRYLVVFDDVWQKEFWGAIESLLPKNNKGSKILITTRNVEVANSSLSDRVLLQTWSLEKALELFRKKVGQCPKELEDLSRAIVRRCRGLPLVIATVAGLLSKKEKVELEWQRMLDDLISKSEMDSQLLEILSLSYYDLPSPLKCCFLYFGIFPEDSSILDERLYALWIAEGFIEARGNRTLEEVAEDYLNELIQRNLVTFQLEVGEGKKCGVHDLMHEVILSRADKVCLCRTWDENESRFRGAGRRLRISGSIENVLKNVGASTLRSVFFWDIDDELIETESSVVTLFKRFKLLEVMDFQRVPLNTLPKEMGNLFLLKYLSLKETNVKVLPKSIRNLQKLQTLDIRDTLIRELPAEINELRNLRHLLAYTCDFYKSWFDYIEGVRMLEGFGNLENLQTLTTFEAHPGGVGLVKELELLRKLRWLDVSKITSETWRGVCASIGNMDHLQRLCLHAKDENEVLDLQHISSPPRFLRELSLTGRLQNFHDMIPMFRNLRGLSLACSLLIDDPCKCLKELPNLESLILGEKVYVGEELHFEKGGFEKLKELSFRWLGDLKHIKIDEGALPALEKIVLYGSPLLEELPSVNHLRKLKHFVVDGRRVSD